MSIKLMTMVWEKYPASGSELLAMLALADWAGDDGGSLYPSMSALAAKIRLSEKQARRIVQDLVHQGILLVVGNEHGGAPGTTKQFRLNVRKLAFLPDLPKKLATKKSAESLPSAFETAPADVTPPVDVTPPAGVRDGSRPCPETAPAGGSQTVIEPSIEPSIKGKRVSAPCAQAPTFPPLDESVVPVVKNPEPAPVAATPAPVAAPVVAEAAVVVPVQHTPIAQPKAATKTTAKPAGDKTAVAAAVAVACPSDVPAAVFADFLTIRKAKRAPLTATALGGIRREADKAGVTLEEALTVCCERGWVGFRADWYHEGNTAPVGTRTGGNGGAAPNPNKQEALEARNRAVAEKWVADMQAKMNAQGGAL